MKKILTILYLLIFTLNLFGSERMYTKSKIDSLILEVRKKYLPDSRDGIFDIKAVVSNDTVFLSGKGTSRKAIDELKSQITGYAEYIVSEELISLPSKALNDTIYGVINVSVADIRTQNKFVSGMATQALLGTPVKIYDKEDWYQIQLPDSYFGWVHKKQIISMNKRDFNSWILSPKIIYTKHYGFSYQQADKDGDTVSDLVAGNILSYEGVEGNYFKVSYPDKRIAYVLRKESQEYSIWLQSRIISGDSFVEMANSMMGIPYVWGGTSTKGFDCSGLISNILFLHGLIIKRDASQQASIGITIDISNGYNNLKIGDLLFFGTKSNNDTTDNVRHVGIYIGNGRFIHASGYIRINSLNRNDLDYDEPNAKEFIKATRIVDYNKLKGIQKLKNNAFYDIQK